jgi:hypothetical protein
VKFSDFPQPGSIEIPYYDIDGYQTGFSRYRLPKPLADGQKYHKQPGTGVHVYFPPNGIRKPKPENIFGIDPQALILEEGEFKCLALHDAGIRAIGLPSFCVYTNDDNGRPRLLMDLRVAIQKWSPTSIYFIGDNDTATNFEFARSAVFLAWTIAPVELHLPRIPLDGPKGPDDLREKLKEQFDPFLRELIKSAVLVSPKLSSVALAIVLLEREAPALNKLAAEERERHFGRIIKMCAAAERTDASSAEKARLRDLAASILKIGKRDLKRAVAERLQRDREEFKKNSATGGQGKDAPSEQQLRQEKEAQRQLEHASKVLQGIDAYYDGRNRTIAVRTDGKHWEIRTEDTFTRKLRMLDVSKHPLPLKKFSAAEWIIERLQATRSVDYVGTLAGRRIGYFEENGMRILVTNEANLVEPVQGPFDTISAFIDGLFTASESKELAEIQRHTVLGWLQVYYKSLRDDFYHPGQALGLAGPPGCGKSVFQKLITRIFGGRSGRAAMFLKKRTDFNSDLARAEHLILEDENNDISISARLELGTAIKQITVNEENDVHAKGRDKVSFSLRQRLSISCNDRAQRLLIFPPLDEDIGSKIMLLGCSAFDFPMPLESEGEKRAFWQQIDKELPGFLYFLLNDYRIPENLRDRRFGVATFHHPQLAQHLQEFSPQAELLELIDLLKPWGTLDKWEGSSKELRLQLFKHDSTHDDGKRLLKYPNACGEYLGDLAKSHPHRVKDARTKYARRWIVYSPVGQSVFVADKVEIRRGNFPDSVH